MTVALLTCADLPDGDEDGAALIAALAARGVTARWQVWNDPWESWDDDLAVVRSTWDYTRDRDAFVAWARTVPHLVNPAEVIVWNSDKIYLRDLAEAGVPVVDTVFVAPGDSVSLPRAGEFVVKPSIGAGSMGVGRFGTDMHVQARAHLAALHAAGRVALVQPYLSDVDSSGETALVYFDGQLSHAIRKAAMLPTQLTRPLDQVSADTLYLLESIEAREPSARELALGAQVMQVLRDRFGADLVYSRVDLLPTPAGPVLVELELTEPSLFLAYDPAAVERLADAIAVRA